MYLDDIRVVNHPVVNGLTSAYCDFLRWQMKKYDLLRQALKDKWIAYQEGKLELHQITDYPDMSDLASVVTAELAGTSSDYGPATGAVPPTALQAGAQSASATPEPAAGAAAPESAVVYSASEDQAPPRGFAPGDLDGLG